MRRTRRVRLRPLNHRTITSPFRHIGTNNIRLKYHFRIRRGHLSIILLLSLNRRTINSLNNINPRRQKVRPSSRSSIMNPSFQIIASTTPDNLLIKRLTRSLRICTAQTMRRTRRHRTSHNGRAMRQTRRRRASRNNNQ